MILDTATIVLLVLVLMAFLLSWSLAARHFLHMFQLNSYKPKVQLDWLKKNLNSLVPKTLLALFTVPAIILWGKTGLAIAGIIYIILAYFYKPRQAKTPLVYTKRIVRMLITSGIIMLVLLAAAVILWGGRRILFPVVLFGTYALTPLIILLANFINKPVEKAINHGFIKEAQQILADMPDLKIIGITGSFGKRASSTT